MMKKIAMLTAALAVLLAPIAQAAAYTLDFSGSDICDTNPGGPPVPGACTANRRILLSYGDVPGVLDVSHDNDVNSTGGDERLMYWPASYSGLVDVAWGGFGDTSGRPELFLEPLAGYSVTLLSFQLGAFPNQDRTTQYSVLTGLGDPLFESPQGVTIPGAAPTTVAGPWSSSDGLRIQWGPNGYNVGIDNIVFSVDRINAVPEPATISLLAIGLAGIGWAARRRTR